MDTPNLMCIHLKERCVDFDQGGRTVSNHLFKYYPLKKHNIDVVTHIMIGLPGETLEDLQNTIDFVNKHDINGIKIHNVYVVKNTKLEERRVKLCESILDPLFFGIRIGNGYDI